MFFRRNNLRQLKGRFHHTVSEGQSIPNVPFKARVRDESIGGSNPFKWKDVRLFLFLCFSFASLLSTCSHCTHYFLLTSNFNR